MRIGTFVIVAAALALGLAAWTTPGMAQGPMWDVVHVDLPYTVTVGDKVLQPGDYTIQQLHSQGGGRNILLIYSDNGMKFETSAMTIPTLDLKTPDNTSVVLHHYGHDYYFDKVWIQGKNYGYEFPLPASARAREQERMAAASVPATYSTMPAEENTEKATTAEETKPATSTPATPPPVVAQNEEPTPTTVPAEPIPEPSANREMAQATPPPATPSTEEMPATSAGWLLMLLGGGSLSAVGLALKRR